MTPPNDNIRHKSNNNKITNAHCSYTVDALHGGNRWLGRIPFICRYIVTDTVPTPPVLRSIMNHLLSFSYDYTRSGFVDASNIKHRCSFADRGITVVVRIMLTRRRAERKHSVQYYSLSNFLGFQSTEYCCNSISLKKKCSGCDNKRQNLAYIILR